jgi:uracil-DNA glycosylase
LLWGAFAQGKKSLIDEKKHLILETTHPSPFSAYR